MKLPLAQRRRVSSAFTLVEVILAVAIATGILVVALSFYQQAASLRAQILEASDRISAIRLLMDRLATELRTARAHDWEGFTGDATSLRFVKTEALSSAAWTRTQPSTDLRLVTFGVATGLDGTNMVITGVTRTERPVFEPRQARAGALAEPSASTNMASMANMVSEPISDAIHFLHFRFWDGDVWLEAWADVVPPLAVEVSFGLDPQPDDALPDEYPFEVFRRVVALPGGRESDPFDLFADTAGETKNSLSKP